MNGIGLRVVHMVGIMVRQAGVDRKASENGKATYYPSIYLVW